MCTYVCIKWFTMYEYFYRSLGDLSTYGKRFIINGNFMGPIVYYGPPANLPAIEILLYC